MLEVSTHVCGFFVRQDYKVVIPVFPEMITKQDAPTKYIVNAPQQRTGAIQGFALSILT